jgi:hypothetical protein
LSSSHFNRIGSDYNDNLVKQQWGETFLLGRTDNSQYVHAFDDTFAYKLYPRVLPANATT